MRYGSIAGLLAVSFLASCTYTGPPASPTDGAPGNKTPVEVVIVLLSSNPDEVRRNLAILQDRHGFQKETKFVDEGDLLRGSPLPQKYVGLLPRDQIEIVKRYPWVATLSEGRPAAVGDRPTLKPSPSTSPPTPSPSPTPPKYKPRLPALCPDRTPVKEDGTCDFPYPGFRPPEIGQFAYLDKNGNKIVDALEERAPNVSETDEISISVYLIEPPNQSHFDMFNSSGGILDSRSLFASFYGFRGEITIGRIHRLAERLGPALDVIYGRMPDLIGEPYPPIGPPLLKRETLVPLGNRTLVSGYVVAQNISSVIGDLRMSITRSEGTVFIGLHGALECIECRYEISSTSRIVDRTIFVNVSGKAEELQCWIPEGCRWPSQLAKTAAYIPNPFGKYTIHINHPKGVTILDIDLSPTPERR